MSKPNYLQNGQRKTPKGERGLLRLERRAIRNRWNIPPEQTDEVMQHQLKAAVDPNHTPRTRLESFLAILQASRHNLEVDRFQLELLKFLASQVQWDEGGALSEPLTPEEQVLALTNFLASRGLTLIREEPGAETGPPSGTLPTIR